MATFVHKGFDDTRRLGLQSETKELVRHASALSETEMLEVDSVVPGGPAYEHLEPGGPAYEHLEPGLVLVRMNGEVITQFLKMETLLDDSVGKNVELEYERGGTSLTVQLVVEDLHSITPNYFLEIPGNKQHFMVLTIILYAKYVGKITSYMLYRAGVPWHALIKRLADKDTSNLEDFVNVLSKLSKGARVPLEYINYKDRHRKKSVLVTVDRHEWYASPQIYIGEGVFSLSRLFFFHLLLVLVKLSL